MANVVLAFWSENGLVMYDAIANSLKKNGNNVMCIDFHGFIDFKKFGQSYTINSTDKDFLWKKISDFKPELILSFNNIFSHEFVEKLNCPVCVVDADTPNMAFWHKDVLKENKDRYTFLGLQRASKKFYEEAFGKIDRYTYFPPATGIKKIHKKQDINISFIGSSFLSVPSWIGYYDFAKDKELFDDILLADKNMRGVFCNDFDVFKKKYFRKGSDGYKHKVFRWFFYNNLSGMERVSYLSVLTDLGLKIYGLNTWRETLYFNIDLARCFDDKKVVTLKDNLDIYNRSKISINISHKQAVSSFSWRVMDIMASNSCLLMEDKPDWRDLFEKYLSPDVLDTIIYKDRFDMRQKAIKLLNDEKLRLKCVKQLNNAIEKNGRWDIRFKSFEKFIGIKLTGIKNKSNEYIIVAKDKSIEQPVEQIKTKKPFLHGLHLKNRYKLMWYLFLSFIAQIPILDLFIRSKKRIKLFNKLQRWWR